VTIESVAKKEPALRRREIMTAGQDSELGCGAACASVVSLIRPPVVTGHVERLGDYWRTSPGVHTRVPRPLAQRRQPGLVGVGC